MAYRYGQRGPPYWNSQRPINSPPSQHNIQQQQQYTTPQLTPPRFSPHGQQFTPANTRTTPEPRQTFKNPNLMPVVPRYAQSTTDTYQDQQLEEHHLPQIWPPSTDDLIRRTAHAYDLVMNYQRDASGGQRWLAHDIATIRDVGTHLHSSIFALRRQQRLIAAHGDNDTHMMQQVKRDANTLKLLCERIQRAITKYEQKCALELLRDGVYAQDEEGNFYRPMAPQRFLDEGGHLLHVAQVNETGQVASHTHQHVTETSRRLAMPTMPSPPPQRSMAARPRSLTPTSKSVTARNPSPSHRTVSGRVSKMHKAPSSAQTHTFLSSRGGANKEPRGRSRDNIEGRNGLSRRQAKKERTGRQIAGQLGKHTLHW